MFNFSQFLWKRGARNILTKQKTAGSGKSPRELFELKRKSKTCEFVDEFCEFFVSLKIFLERQYTVSEKGGTNWHLPYLALCYSVHVGSKNINSV